ncbi:MAG: GNAT family N-acetyltransferase [Gaiellaceae bacterium MAG52_C11]|nr:GNAT family N-acetyltransferase [Candidatus Gaiellasilicea maunaloa]
MSLAVRPVENVEELAAGIGAIGHYFGGWPTLEQAERFGRNLPLERMHAAFDGENVVGGAGAFPFELTIPGGQLRCGGVTVVGVLPTHRRRGVLTSMMRAQLEDIRDRGEPLAALWASEEAIYRRYGYGMAALGTELALARGYHALRPPADPEISVRLVSLEDAKELVPQIYERTRLRTPGMYARSSDWWGTRILDDPPDRREDGAAKNAAIADLDGVPSAYALYRVVSKWEGAANAGHVGIIEAMGDDRAELELWRYLLGLDWVGNFRANHLPIDHPLLHALVYPRRALLRLYDTLFLRLVDVGTALAARSYASEEALVLELEDDFLPKNSGRWRIADGGAERTEDEPDLALDVTEAASLYLGAFGASELVRAGLVRELREGAAQRADRLFAIPRKPWCPEIF